MDDAEDNRRLTERLELGFPLLSDSDLAVASAYGVAMEGRDIAVPATFLVDRQGRVRLRYVGETMTDRPSTPEVVARALEVSAGGPR